MKLDAFIQKTKMRKATEDVPRKWYLIDADGVPLGRLASVVATLLRGKHKPDFTPHVDMGDFVVVINAEKVELTGKKWDQKVYYRHSGYPGGLKATPYRVLRQKKPEFTIWKAVKGMLPKNRLSRKQLRHLKIYRGPEHPHEAQRPQPVNIKDVNALKKIFEV